MKEYKTSLTPGYQFQAVRAEYNLHNNFLLMYFDKTYRASASEKEDFMFLVQELGKKIGWGRGVIEGVWSVQFEDLLLTGEFRGQKIMEPLEIELICEADDAEARTARYQRYAERAEKEGLAARERWGRANTARRMRLSGNRSVTETERSEYWWGKVARVVSHAEFVEDPDSIITKLKTLEKEINGHERELPEYVGSAQDKGQRWAKWPYTARNFSYDLQKMIAEGRDPGVARAEIDGKIARIQAYHRRYVEHLRRWEEYLKMYLEEAGGEMPKPAPRKTPRKAEVYAKPSNCEKGGGYFDWYQKTWRKVVRISPQTIAVACPVSPRFPKGEKKVDIHWNTKKTEFMSKAAYEQFLSDGIEKPGE